MPEKIQAVKGMNDGLPPETSRYAHIEARARRILEAFGYREIRTPIAEYTPLFSRGIGEGTDIVEKEMYTFSDRDGRQLTLRPEGTAPAVRAYVEHSIAHADPVTRWYYLGPMFRHERMQRGRYRQFHQIGAEVLGAAEATLDAEMIAMIDALLRDLEITDFTMAISSVGSAEDRPAFRAALVAFFEPKKDQLCPDCQRRLVQNPLRILDCKVEGCRAASVGAPSPLDHLGEKSRAALATVRSTLDRLGVPYEIDQRLVRGLDYYTGVVFEPRARGGSLGAQTALGGGGRYDGLVESLGGPATPAAGFAMGLERLALCLPGEPNRFATPIVAAFVTDGEDARRLALELSHPLRLAGASIEVDHRGASLKSQLKRADKLGAHWVVLLGTPEMTERRAKLKDMRTSEQTEIPFDELGKTLREKLGR
jgi:histidyl-tRNA synthetase